ncbi:hypothetical protein LXL04_021365 [Taraxacum kok-saghyz]
MDVGRERESQFVIEGETERGVLPDEESQLVIEGETESNLAIGDWRLEIWNCTGDWRFEIAIGDWRLTIGINGNPRFIPQIVTNFLEKSLQCSRFSLTLPFYPPPSRYQNPSGYREDQRRSTLGTRTEETQGFHTPVERNSSAYGLVQLLSPPLLGPIATCGTSPTDSIGMIMQCYMSNTIGRRKCRRNNHTNSRGTRTGAKRHVTHTTTIGLFTSLKVFTFNNRSLFSNMMSWIRRQCRRKDLINFVSRSTDSRLHHLLLAAIYFIYNHASITYFPIIIV